MSQVRSLAVVVGSIVLAAVLVGMGAPAPSGPPAGSGGDPNNPPPNGPRMIEGAWHAITNVTVHPKPGETIEHATIVVRDGRIVSVSGSPPLPPPPPPPAGSPKPEPAAATTDTRAAPPAPAGARVWDGTGLHVYAGMIDPYVEIDAPRPDVNQPGVHWSRRVTPQRRAVDGALDDATNKRLRDMGFVAAHVVPRGGIFRGSSAVISLAEPPALRSGSRVPVYREDVVQAVAFDTAGVGGEGTGGAALDRWDGYPDSQMGAIALVRQTLMDAQWRADGRGALSGSNGKKTEQAHSMGFDEPAAIDLLAKRDPHDGGPSLMWVVDDELEILRAEKVAREFVRPNSIYVGMGTEYQRLDAIKDRLKSGGAGKGGGGWLVVPLNYPDEPKVESLGAAAEIELRTLMEWEQAPANAMRLDKAGVKFALTTGRVPDRRGGRGKFMENLRNAVRHGLPEDRAIALVTTEPAAMLGMEKDLGTVEAGKLASFVVTDGPLLDKKTKVRDVWVDGRRHEVNVAPTKLEGEYDVTIEPGPKVPGALTMSIDKDNGVTLKKVAPAEPPAPEGDKGAGAAKPDGEKPADTKVPDKRADESIGRVAPPTGEERRREKDRKIDEAVARIHALQAEDKIQEAIQVCDQILFLDPGNARATQLKEQLNNPAKPAADKPAKEKSDKPDKPKDKTARAKNVKIDGKAGTISYVFDHEPFGDPGMFTVSGTFDKTADGKGWMFRGEATRADGTPFRWSATPKAPEAKDAKKDDEKKDKDDKDKKDADKAGDKPAPPNDDGVSGAWTLKVSGGQIPAGQDHPVTLTLKLADNDKLAATLAGPMGEATIPDATYDKATGTIKGAVAFGQGPPGTMTLTIKGESLTGTSQTGGDQYQITGTRTSKPDGAKSDKAEDDEDKPVTVPDLPGYPFGPFAMKELPPKGALVITGATVWTCGPAGKVENGVVIVNDGKIVYAGGAGKAPAAPANARTIDAKGKHVTPGLIDCHSHTGISRGVNESGQAVTAEVRIQDVLNPDAMNWYRQLAGGLTCVNNLHGSANPIGGQNAVNKIRWGVSNPDDMHFGGADSYADNNPFGPPGADWKKSTVMPGIKFALGENVKQSNWGDGNTTRYPQTRMGVETLIKDRFTAAREYAAAWDAYAKDGSGLPPRRDLELEALAQLLNGTRLIHCHSYRQDEILMLARLTKDFGFRLGTYQHNLEGYKVADAVKDSSIGASIFSDWWAYKIEVQDAIPYAGSIMHDQGVVVSFNSDSDELARRMNYEAAKAVKYGGTKPEEALLFVTLNPAKQLKIDDRVGSLEAGKDADITIWSGDPLSSFTRCEATYVDGREMYSIEADAKMRAHDASERQRLIQKALGAGKAKKPGGGAEAGEGRPGGGPTGDAPGGRRRGRPPQEDAEIADEVARSGRSALIYRSVVNADSVRREYYMSLLKRGINPEDAGHARGECGCDLNFQDWANSGE